MKRPRHNTVAPSAHATVTNLHDISLPKSLREHALFKDRLYYVLPENLLHAIGGNIQIDTSAADALAVDQELSAKLRGRPQIVAYDRGRPVLYEHLAPRQPLPRLSAETLQLFGWDVTPEQYALTAETLDARSDWYVAAVRGYLGWLLTCLEFRQERDQLFSRWETQVARHGLPGPTIFATGSLPPTIAADLPRHSDEFVAEFTTFYTRWRLSHLVTRDLPEPLTPQIPILSTTLLSRNHAVGAITLFQPDTLPVPARDLLCELLNEQRAAAEAAHLEEWFRVVRKDRPNRKAITKFAHVFVLQHYWRIVTERYPKLLSRTVGRLERAFAEFLNVKPAAIEKYRRFLSKPLASS